MLNCNHWAGLNTLESCVHTTSGASFLELATLHLEVYLVARTNGLMPMGTGMRQVARQCIGVNNPHSFLTVNAIYVLYAHS